MSLRRSAATAAISTSASEERPIFSGANSIPLRVTSVEGSVENNPAKWLDYGRTNRRWFSIKINGADEPIFLTVLGALFLITRSTKQENTRIMKGSGE